MFVISKASEVVRFEILTAVFLDSQVFWDVTYYCWAQNSWWPVRMSGTNHL